MAKIERFEDVEAWKLARESTKLIYDISGAGYFAKDFPLRDQIRKSSVSIMSNIAEGFERDGDREFVNFLSIAKGSCGEARSQLYVAFDQRYVTEEQFQFVYSSLNETGKRIGGFMKYLQQSNLRGPKFR
ncbi:MAG: four helix bundle protein [Acidobacteria bacterium]|nr:four helix bundle protein [Acidobacteriota bacterium]